MTTRSWKRYLERLSSRRMRRTRDLGRRPWGHLGPVPALESRLLLAADVQIQVIAGTLYLNGFVAGNRDVTVSQDAVNLTLLDVTPGAGTTVNGSSSAFQLPGSQVRFGVAVSLNNGFGTGGSTRFLYTASSFVLPGSLSVNLWGNGADTVGLGAGQVSGSLFVTTGSGNDSVSLTGLHVGGITSVNTGLGADTVHIQSSTFGMSFAMDGGIGGGDALNVDDATFGGLFSAIMWNAGNAINVEQNPALPNQTAFNGPAYFQFLGSITPGAGGAMNIGTLGPNNDVALHTTSLFLGANVRMSPTVDSGPSAPLLVGSVRNPTPSLPSSIGVDFQPYIGAWTGSPSHPPAFNSYTYQDVLNDLTRVKAQGFTSIKTYGVGTSPFSELPGGTLDSNQYNVPAAHALGLKVEVGANLQYDGTTLNVSRTQLEIRRAIQQAVANPGTVVGLIVGNETIGVNGVTVADMVSLMNYAKAQRDAAGFTAATLPVSTAQQWGVLAGPANADLSRAAEGAVYANIYPFFDSGTTINTSITQFRTDYNALRTALNSFGLSSLQIVVGETGWASAGTNTVNPSGVPSLPNSQKYFSDYVGQVTVPAFMFEAFDEPWKANPTTDPQSVEPHFGLIH